MTSKTNPEHDFTLVLGGFRQLSREIVDAFFEACDDCTLAMRGGRPYASFSREAPSLKDAILSAIRDVLKVRGVHVVRVDFSNLVSQAEIARKIGKTRQMVHRYASGIRSPGGFPPPVSRRVNDEPLWYWNEVAHWLWENDMVPEGVYCDAEAVDSVNVTLEYLNKMRHPTPLLREVRSVLRPKKIA